MKEKQSGLKMSSECTWDRAVALIRATAQRIISKKVELPSSSIDEAPTVTKVTLDDFDQSEVRRIIAGMYAQKKRLPTLKIFIQN